MGKRIATAIRAKTIFGHKPYQKRARAALPLLVRQAKAGATIFYSELGAEMGIPNPRNFNDILGSIGQTLEELSTTWGKGEIPPLQCVVINKDEGLPGEGIGWFLIKKEDFASLPLAQKQGIVNLKLREIFDYRKWDEVLAALRLQSVLPDFSGIISSASASFGIGESEHHKALKKYVAENPTVVGLPKRTPVGEIEYPLPSGDLLDVSFATRSEWIGVEVKSKISSEVDIARGLFQCVKYKAVMNAVQSAQLRQQRSRAVLVLEGELPPSLVVLRTILGINVMGGIVPAESRLFGAREAPEKRRKLDTPFGGIVKTLVSARRDAVRLHTIVSVGQFLSSFRQ